METAEAWAEWFSECPNCGKLFEYEDEELEPGNFDEHCSKCDTDFEVNVKS